jgi:hypothetical protein
MRDMSLAAASPVGASSAAWVGSTRLQRLAMPVHLIHRVPDGVLDIVAALTEPRPSR